MRLFLQVLHVIKLKVVFLCRWGDLIHRKYKRVHETLLEITNEFSKVTGCWINTMKDTWKHHAKWKNQDIKFACCMILAIWNIQNYITP